MTRILRIEHCIDCPSFGFIVEHGGIAGLYCQRVDDRRGEDGWHGRLLTAWEYGEQVPMFPIPEWCPLELAEDG